LIPYVEPEPPAVTTEVPVDTTFVGEVAADCSCDPPEADCDNVEEEGGGSDDPSKSEAGEPKGDKAGTSPGAGADGGMGSAVPPARKPRRTVASRMWAGLFSFGPWRKETQLQKNAAEAVATYRGICLDGKDDIEVAPKYGVVGSMRQAINDRFSESLHNVRHRAARRFWERARTLKALSAELKFKTHGFDKSEADMRSLAIAAKGVVDSAIDDKTIHKSQANWYKRALVACYHMRDEDDQFFERMCEVAGSSPM
jgi:hypothetical protein